MATILHRPMFWLLAAATVAIAGWGLWPRAQDVDVAVVDRGPLEVAFTEEARTRLVDRWTVSAPAAGRLERIELEPGDAVERGQVVARLHPATAPLLDAGTDARARAQLASAQQGERAADAAVAAARATADVAGAEFARVQALARERLVAASSLDATRERDAAARAGLRAALARASAARSDREAAAALLATAGRDSPGAPLQVRAPVDGRVIRLHEQSEVTVQPGRPLLDVGDPHALEVVSELLTTDAMRLAPGAPVQLGVGDASPPLQARVERIEPGGFTKVSALGVEEQRVNVVIDFDAPREAWQALGDAYRVDARIVVESRADAVLVPVSALFRQDERWSVFAAEGGRARRVEVVPGPRNATQSVIERGLDPGVEVIVFPGDRVADGARIRVRH